MPILVKDFTWDQNDETIIIMVPLKCVNHKNVSIFTTDSYLKISFPPFFYECFLKAPTINEESSVQIGNGQVVFKLKKSTPSLWEKLESDASDTERERQVLRELAIEEHRKLEEEKKMKADELKLELKRFGVKEQIKLEQDHRKWIEDEKKKERDKAEQELETWKEQHKDKKDVKNISEDFDSTGLETQQTARRHLPISRPRCSKASPPKKTSGNIFEESAAVRCQAKLSVNFTPRVFPTPSRESMADEENEWLSKQAEARKIMELEDMNLSEEEKNPVWLRDKGNRFFEEGNYESAINAYTHAIRMSGKMASLYSNRAACHLKMGNCFKCLEDCTKALELLTPPIEQNRLSRLKAHLRRGTAFVILKLYAEGLSDYEAALKLDPSSESIRKDAEQIRKIVEGGTEDD